MKYNLLAITFLCLCASCNSSSDVREDPEPFKVEERLEDLGLAEKTVDGGAFSEGCEEDCLEPDFVSEHYIDYRPGVLPWADEKHTVRFHFQSEITTYGEDHPGYPDTARVSNSRLTYFIDTNTVYHGIMTFGWYDAYGYGAAFSSNEPLLENIKDILEWPHSYAGFYLPEYMLNPDKDPMLHLFECTYGRGGTERHIYKLDGFYFLCGAHGSIALLIPDDSPHVDRFKCEAHNLDARVPRIQGEMFGESKSPLYHEECEDFDPDLLTESLEVVAWVGLSQPTKHADVNGYSYLMELEDRPGKVCETAQCTPIEVCDDQGCTSEEPEWRTFLSYVTGERGTRSVD